MKKQLALGTFLLYALTGYAQNAQQYMTEAQKRFDNEEYMVAIDFYKQALKRNPKLAAANYGIAECYRLTFDTESAESYYEIVASAQNTQAFPLARYYFGLMKKLNGDYNGAMLELTSAIDHLKERGLSEHENYRKFYLQARVEREGCQFALTELSKPKLNRDFNHLPYPVNNEHNDYAPYIWEGDFSILVTSSRKEGKGKYVDNKFGESFADFFRFHSNGGSWSEIKSSDRFEKTINSDFGDGAGVFNADNTRFYYTYCNDEQENCYIYVSKLIGGKWSDPLPLNSNINVSGYNSNHPHLSASGDTLYFSSNRQFGQGGLDIWMSTSPNGEDKWTPPINMGPQVNTAFDEISPFYDYSQNALFFASTGHRGFGGYDIFMATGNTIREYEIFNIGTPYNSFKDECFFVLGEEHGYLSSNRDGGLGKFDIYSFKIENEAEIITSIQSEEAISGRNSLFDDDYEFDNANTNKINDLISQFLANKIAGTGTVLSAQDQEFYMSLSKDDRNKIERIVNARFRHMTDNDLRTLRIEDEFFYQKLANAERELIDEMVVNRLQQRDLGLSVDINNDSRQYYADLSVDDREKVDQLVAYRMKESEEITYVPTTYNDLDANSQKQVNTLSDIYFSEKKNLEALSISPTTIYFLKKLNETDKNNVYKSVKEKLVTFSSDSKYELRENDRVFYQNLSTKDKETLESLASTILLSNIETLSENLTDDQIKFYKYLNETQRKSADRILAKFVQNMFMSDLYFVTAHLTSEEITALYNETLNLGSYQEALAAVLPPEKIEIIQRKDHAVKLERFVHVTADKVIAEKIETYSTQPKEGQALASSTTQAPQTIATRTSTSTQQGSGSGNTVSSSGTTGGGGNAVASATSKEESFEALRATGDELIPTRIADQRVELTDEDVDFYESLSESQKRSVDRFIAAQIINEQYEQNPGLKNSDQTYFEGLSRVNQYKIQLLREKMRGEKEIPEESLISARTYYNNAAENTKAIINRLVYSDVLELRNGQYYAKAEDQSFVTRLSENQKLSLDLLAEHRFANKRAISENQSVEANDLPENRVLENLVKYNTAQYKYLFVSGQLTDEKTGKPLANFPVAARNDKGVIEYQTYTDREGKFTFENIPSNDYQIVTGGDNPASVYDQSFFVRNLRITGMKANSLTHEVSTHLYYNSGLASLRLEAKLTLDDLIKEYHRHKGAMVIEIHGHTDNVGDEKNNLELSKRRSEAVFDYLVKSGVKAQHAIINFHGQSRPAAANDNRFGRQFNRRVDMNLLSNLPIHYQPMQIYLIRPNGTLFSIANHFEVTVDEIKAWNGLTSNSLTAYSPLRIENKDGRRPLLEMLVELNESVELTTKTYVVKAGDTIQSIASLFNLPVEFLVEYNNLSSNDVEIGQELQIYLFY